MKKSCVSILAVLCLFFVVDSVSAHQWILSGIDIRNANTGNVNIGGAVSRSRLNVSGGMSLNDTANLNKVFIIGYNSTKDFAFLSPWDWASFTWRNLAINAGGGNVSIGTNPDPLYTLVVGGTIKADDIVTISSGADFVFDPDYELTPLAEVDTFIQENRHLPGIPKAEEMQTGVSVAEMQVKLLQKIEELTLHLIEQNQAITELRQENSALRHEMTTLRGEAQD